MKILLEVFKDLWNFFTFGLFRRKVGAKIAYAPTPLVGSVKTLEKEIVGIHRKPDQIHTEIDFGLFPVTGISYVCVEKSDCFIRPVWAFDSVLMTLVYGDPVRVIGYEGRFAQISFNGHLMWLLKDDIISEKSDIFPTFVKNKVYLSSNSETKKLRKLTNDSFFASKLELPLQAVEFVSYRLGQDGRKILWTNERPRLAGNWQNILKGQLGVHITVSPKTASIIEYRKDDSTGHVGYVKEVHVNNSIVLQEVGREVEGEYTENEFTRSQWQEWRPVFIQVT